MSFIQEALEECKGCKPSAQVSQTDAWKGTPDPKAIVDTGTTYDDGKGVKDTVVISGPLSHAYTQALLLTLKKEPLQGQEDAPTPEEVVSEEASEEDPLLKKKGPEPIGIATETIQQDEDIELYMEREFKDNAAEVDFLANKFDFVRPDQLPTNVVCKTTLITMTDFLKIDNFIEFTQDRKNSSIEHVLVVVADTLGRTSKNTTQTKLIDIGIVADERAHEFNAAVEAYVRPAGYKVFEGMEQYFKYLRTLSETLCI